MADGKYCIMMRNIPGKKFDFIEGRDPHSPVKGNDGPVTFDSVDEAVEATKMYKQWHPEITFEVRQYFGSSRYVFEIATYGEFQRGKETLARL